MDDYNVAGLFLMGWSLAVLIYRLCAMEYIRWEEGFVALFWGLIGGLIAFNILAEFGVSGPVAVLLVALGAYHIRKVNITGPDAITEREQVHLKDATIVVTGSNCGIGLETALHFAKTQGGTCKVILACRNEQAAREAQETIIRTSGNQKVFVEKLDLGSFESIKACVKRLADKYGTVDILVNNAGILTPSRSETVDGFESNMQVNCLGQLLFTCLMLPVLYNSKVTEPSRIVFVNSSIHRACNLVGGFAFHQDDPNMSKLPYGMFRAYGSSKLSILILANELNRKLQAKDFSSPLLQHMQDATIDMKKRVTINSLMPGTITTKIARNMAWYMEIGHHYIIPYLMKNCEQGSRTTIFTATSASLNKVSGQYFEHCTQVPLISDAKDPKLANQLWQWAETCLQPHLI